MSVGVLAGTIDITQGLTLTSLAGVGTALVKASATGLLSRALITDFVSSIIAGTNVTISSTGAGGTGAVTVNAVPAGLIGQIQYNAGSNLLGASANLFWDIANGKLGVQTNTPGANAQVSLTADGAPTTITNWDNRHVAFTNGGTSTSPGIGFSYDAAGGFAHIHFNQPGVTYRRGRMNFFSMDWYSSGSTLGLSQDNAGNVTAAVQFTDTGLSGGTAAMVKCSTVGLLQRAAITDFVSSIIAGSNITISSTGAGGTGAVTVNLRNASPLAVLGNPTNATTTFSDIVATPGSGQVLVETGSTLAFSTVATAGITNNAITNAKLATAAASTYKGNPTAGVANEQDVVVPVNNRVVVSDGNQFTSDSALIWDRATHRLGVGGNPSAALHASVTNDTAPASIGSWDGRHMLCGLGGGTASGLGMSVESGSSRVHIHALQPGTAYLDLQLNLTTLHAYSGGGGGILGLSQDASGNVIANQQFTDVGLAAGGFVKAAVGGQLQIGTVPGRLKSFTVLTSGSGTYTPAAGITSLLIDICGGGGGGGGVAASMTAGVGGGGGGGGNGHLWIPTAVALTYAVGAAGTGGSTAGGSGGGGGNSSVTDGGANTLTCFGGSGGTGEAINVTTLHLTPGASGGGLTLAGGSWTALVNGNGGAGGYGLSLVPGTTAYNNSGSGGTSFGCGAGGVGGLASPSNGLTGLGYGSGGSGAINIGTATGKSGGSGATGIIVIYEFL
jgi:hypothetical protein